jgi:predicted O-methyltransferase YrrM
MHIIRPGMGTENSANLISALIGMSRPNTVVEIGAGDSTIFIAKALQQARKDWKLDKDALDASTWQERTALLDPTGIPGVYQPRLITIDNFSAEGSSAEAAWDALRNDDIDASIVTFIERDFYALDDAIIGSWGAIDIAWIDAGTPADDVRFVAALWKHIAPGGYLCLHEPTMLTTVNVKGAQRIRRVRTPVWEDLYRRLDDSFELVTLPELHKYRQSGLGVLRKRRPDERVFRTQSLQSELVELGEIPVRSDYLPIGEEALKQRVRKDAIMNAMTSREARCVHAAITLGANRVMDIAARVGIDVKTVNRIVSRLLSIGLVQQGEKGLSDVDDVWEEISSQKHRSLENLSDRRLETDVFINKIATAFTLDTDYSESQISGICQLFTTDYARLRRYLVDRGVLQRRNDVYRRAS